ncbi:MAG: GNAT family N-acetyltransferase [Verrucomicrobiales bacterium]|nr:GNAT family N-acetyltransferase [Verrucomicrobiales bacterium]
MNWRRATDFELDLLAEWNHQLIEDEGHRNPMCVAELRERMRGWLFSDYIAVVFANDEDVAYALFRESEEEIYLRQFFVRRDKRRSGVGSRAMAILFEEIWPRDKRLTVDALVRNAEAVAFWRSVGYLDYCLSLEILPNERSAQTCDSETPTLAAGD